MQCLLVFDRHVDVLVGRDVRDVGREQVRPFLLDQRRLPALGPCLLVGGARRRTLA
jgi:hypothetical protein